MCRKRAPRPHTCEVAVSRECARRVCDARGVPQPDPTLPAALSVPPAARRFRRRHPGSVARVYVSG